MIQHLRPIAPVLLGLALFDLAQSLVGPLITLRLGEGGVATAFIGLVNSCYFIGFLVGSMTCARVIDRVGHIRSFSVFAAVSGGSALIHAMAFEPTLWAALRVGNGWAMSGLFMVVESWLNDKSAPPTRGRIFAAYMMVAWFASALGPLLLNFEHLGTTRLFVLVGLGFVVSLLPMALTQVSNPEIGERRHFGIRRLIQISPLGVVACCAAGLINSAYYGLIPIFVQSQGLSATHVSLMISSSLVGGMLAQYPTGMLADRFGRRPVLVGAVGVAALCVTLILVTGGRPFPVLVGLGVCFAAAVAPLYSLGAGQTNDYIERRDFVAASGGLLFAWACGASVGPAAAALAMGQFGSVMLFVYLLVMLGVVALFALYRIRRRAGVPLERQSGFVPAAGTPGGLVPELDPRNDVAPGDMRPRDGMPGDAR